MNYIRKRIEEIVLESLTASRKIENGHDITKIISELK